MTERAAPSWQVWSALWIVYVVWGSTYLAIAYVVETLPPALSAASRFALAAVLLAGWVAARRGRAALRVTRPQVQGAAVVGLGAVGSVGTVTGRARGRIVCTRRAALLDKLHVY